MNQVCWSRSLEQPESLWSMRAGWIQWYFLQRSCSVTRKRGMCSWKYISFWLEFNTLPSPKQAHYNIYHMLDMLGNVEVCNCGSRTISFSYDTYDTNKEQNPFIMFLTNMIVFPNVAQYNITSQDHGDATKPSPLHVDVLVVISFIACEWQTGVQREDNKKEGQIKLITQGCHFFLIIWKTHLLPQNTFQIKLYLLSEMVYSFSFMPVL